MNDNLVLVVIMYVLGMVLGYLLRMVDEKAKPPEPLVLDGLEEHSSSQSPPQNTKDSEGKA